MGAITQQNAVLVAQATDATSNMRQQVGKLTHLVQAFKLIHTNPAPDAAAKTYHQP